MVEIRFRNPVVGEYFTAYKLPFQGFHTSNSFTGKVVEITGRTLVLVRPLDGKRFRARRGHKLKGRGKPVTLDVWIVCGAVDAS